MAYTTIDDPSQYFQTATYTGTSDDSNKTITNDGNSDLQPDWMWIKARSGTYSTRDNALYDSSRGATARLESNATDAEATDSNNVFNTNGFTLTANYSINGPSTNHVGWQWKVNGGTTSSNSNGSITTTVQANTSAGISIVLYTSASGGQTIGHGLGVVPEMYWIKCRNGGAGQNWVVYHKDIPNIPDYGLTLDNNAASSSQNYGSGWFNSTNPTSTVFSIGSGAESGSVSTSGRFYNFYAFRTISGFSSVGSWTGNSSSGRAITGFGFEPKFLLLKDTGSTEQWQVYDATRGLYFWHPNLFNAHGTNGQAVQSFDSDGITIGNDGSVNANNRVYIYLAFGGNAVRADDQT